MKELLEFIIKSLAEDLEACNVTESEREGVTVYEIRVAEGDMGKIIGRQGRIAKAIRTLMKAVAIRDGKRISVDIIG